MTTPQELRASAKVMRGLPALSEKCHVIDDVERYRVARQLEAAAEALDRAEKDAARYRFIRPDFSPMGLDIGGNHSWTYRRNFSLKGPSLDAAIDSAMGVVNQQGADGGAGVAPAAPMQGLADYLRAQASTLDPRNADSIAAIRQWAQEVDAAAGVTDQGMRAAMLKLSRAMGHPNPVDAAHGQCVDAALIEMAAARISGVTVTVPVNRPATPEEAEHAARIGACLPNGAMFDAFGRERVRYVRVIHDGTTCVVSPGDVADLVDPGRPDDYRIEDVYLSKEEFDALPEFNGF